MASTQYAGDSWLPAVVIVQHVHVQCKLLSGSAKVAVSDYGSCFPLGEGMACGGHCV